MEKKPEIEKSKDHPLVPHSNLTIAQQDAILDEWPQILRVLAFANEAEYGVATDILIRLNGKGVI